MRPTEHHVLSYLRHQGFDDILYEPDGNVPPDFVVSGRIAVEARRLNQHDRGNSPRGLEETAIPFQRTVTRTLAAFGPPRSGVSWFVSYNFRRPLPERREEVVAAVNGILERFIGEATPPEEISLSRTVSFRFRRATELHPTMFLVGMLSDYNSGGFVVGELVRNLSICVDEKTRKTAKFRERYPEWWLAFVDYIGYGALDRTDVEDLRGIMAERLVGWRRVILLSPTDATRAVDLL